MLELSDAEEDEQERKTELRNIRNGTKRTSRIVLSSIVCKGDLSLETSTRDKHQGSQVDGLSRTNFRFGQIGLDLT